MVTELRAGVAGAGFVGRAHVNAYAAIEGVRVVAVADPVVEKAQRLAARVGAVALSDFDELLEAGLDVITIGTPSATHATLAIRALEAGLHVLCEKPIARTLADARRIVAAAEEAAGILMVGHVCRYEPDHRRAKDSIEAGDLGTVRMVSHTMTTSVPGWSEVGWLADTEQSGGPLVDLGVHSFDFISWAVGSPAVRVHAVGADTDAGPATYVLATIRYANGAMGLVEASWAHPVSHGFKVSTEIIGTDGRVSWDYDQIAGGVIHFASRDSVVLDPLSDRGFRSELAGFTHAVRTGAPSPVPAGDGFTALRTALAAAESVRTGESIDLTVWGLP
jgi:predicted dehydrogenase